MNFALLFLSGGDPISRTCKLESDLRGKNPCSRVGTLSGETPTMKDFDRPWANRDGACKLVLALSTLSEGHSKNGTYTHFRSDGGHSH